MAATHLCTWFIADLPDEESRYGAGSHSASSAFQLIYWRCVVVYFASCTFVYPAFPKSLFTNCQRDDIPVEILAQLDRLGVTIVTHPIQHRPPNGYWCAWSNQFYIIDICRWIADHGHADDVYLVLDSDCALLARFDALLAEVRRHGIATYSVGYPPDESVNGLSRRQMADLVLELTGQPASDVPDYFGGEFFAATVPYIQRLAPQLQELYRVSLARFAQRQAKFNDEAHLLSFAYYQLHAPAGNANPFFRRIWTGLTHRDTVPADLDLPIWHVPAEKHYGFAKAYRKLRHDYFQRNITPTLPEWRKFLGSVMHVPDYPLLEQTLFFIKRAPSWCVQCVRGGR